MIFKYKKVLIRLCLKVNLNMILTTVKNGYKLLFFKAMCAIYILTLFAMI